ALGDERRRRRHRLPRPHQPHRRLQLPRAGPPRRRLPHLPLDQPRLPGRPPGGAEAGGGRDPLRARRRAGRPWRLAGRHRRGLPAGGGAHPLRRDQAGGGAADRGVPRGARGAGGDRPLRRDRRPLADGEGRPGVFTHWMLAHHFGNPLSYIGFGGEGKQVRDLLHVEDLVDLVERQLLAPEEWDGRTVNVGGGRECSLSLRETTAICQELTGNEVAMTPVAETRAGDVPIYLSDCTKIFGLDEWRPQ